MNTKSKLQSYLAATLQQWQMQRDPFVWRLCLDFKFYQDAYGMLIDAVEESGGTGFLETEEFAPIALIILGEWYKREYTGNNAENPEWIKTTSWERVWKSCGRKHWQRWVYTFEDTNRHSWQYSAYVMGGLACKYMAATDKENRLLKDLCRLFHGQIEESEIDASQNARAIAMSIERYGSIYHYLLDLIDSTSKLNTVYSHDRQEEVKNLRKKIIEANREVTFRKLRTEWIFTTSPYEPENIFRSMKITLGPERVNGEKRWFLSRERAAEWGFDLSKDISEITVKLCLYKDGKQIAAPINVLTFQPTGLLSAGFNNVDENHWKLISNLPVDFDGWRLIAETDGQIVDIDPNIIPVGEYSQIYQTAKNANNWSSYRRRMASAVLFNDNCKITDPDGHPVAGKLLLVDYVPSLHLNWADIPTFVKLNYPVKDGTKDVKLISPLAGYRLVVENRFPSLIDYLPGGNVTVRRQIRSTGEIVDQQMPFAFGFDHISLAWLCDGSKQMFSPAEAILVRQNGEVCEIEKLHKGVVEITAFASGMEATAKVWYMPTNGKEVPGKRDLTKQTVSWGTSSVKTYHASEITDDGELAPTLTVEDGSRDGETALIKVFQPVKRTEIWFDNKLIKLLDDKETAYLPLLNLSNIVVRIFNDEGYHSWCGAEHIDEFKGLRIASPHYLKTGLPRISVINFRDENPPKESAISLGGYIFEKDSEGMICCAPRYMEIRTEADEDPFADDTEEEVPTISPKEALESAIEYNLYSFVFKELMNKQSEMPALLSEIRNRRGEDFWKSHMSAVRRILWENDIDNINIEI